MKPSLRFPEFTDDWSTKKIGDILTIGNGRDYKHLDEGDIPVYGTGGYMLSVDDYLYEGESVAIGRKGTIDKPQFLYGKFWTVDTLFYTRDYVDSCPRFVFEIFNNINWQRYNEATGVPSLSKLTIEKIKVNIPSKEEQEKIAAFLTAVDERIELASRKVEKLETYKRDLTQKIFTRALRFKRDDGSDFPEWKKKKLGDIATVKTGNLNVQDADETAKYIFFDRSEEIKRYREYSFNKEALIYPGEGAKFLPRYFNGKFGLHQRAYAIFDTDGILTKFLYYYLLTKNNHFISTAVGTTVKSLRMNCFESCPVVVPNLDEQQKIATFLSQIDEKITLETGKLEELKKFKKALLQRMFV